MRQFVTGKATASEERVKLIEKAIHGVRARIAIGVVLKIPILEIRLSNQKKIQQILIRMNEVFHAEHDTKEKSS